MSNYYVKTIERAAAPRSKRLRETGGYHSGGTSFPGGGYLPLTGGTITGDLRVRGNFIVGDVVVAMDANGRLHISKGVVSEGDLAAFGAEESEGGGSGGLDIARLWEELEAEDASKVIDESHLPSSVVLQDELTEILDDYPLTTEVNTALGGKADKDWVEEELAKYLLLTGGKISGDLEVTGTLKIGGAVLSYADGRLHVSSTVTSDGDFVAFGDEEGSTGSGGLDVDRMWDELEAEGTEQIHASHLSDALTGYATQTYVDGRINDLINGAPAAYDTLREIADVLEGNVNSIGDILTALGGKADKATTLAGYGITDAYTKTQIDGELAKYVTIAGNQDVTGIKTFVNGIKIGSISLSVVDGRLHVSSSVTSDGDFVAFGDEDGASGSGGLDVARLWQELEAKDPAKVIDVSHIPNITKSKISDFPAKWAWADISGKPSTFAPSAHSHAISDVTGLQGELNSKWVWSESQVKAVKVNSAASADNADTLDGVHANGLLTALTSSADTNLSITVGGKPLSVADLYAKYADQLRTARKINGTSFNGAYDITTDKWGMARLVSIKDYTEDNVGATKSVDGSESFSLLLPQSIKVKTLDVDGVTLSVVDGRLHISATATSAGDFVAFGDEDGASGSGGLDVARLWQELEAKDPSKVIDLSHIPAIPTSKITGLDNAFASYATRTWVQQQGYLTSVPKATSSVLGGIKVGYTEISGDKYYAVRVNSSNQAYVHVPWVNTTYSLSSFDITATAAEINKLHGIGTLLHSDNYTSYTVTKTGGGASGTWPISISGNAYRLTPLSMQSGTDLNTLGAAAVGFANYYKTGGISLENGPSDIGDSAGLGFMTWRIASGYSAQLLAATTSNGMMYRTVDSSSNTVLRDWATVLDSSNYTATLDGRYMQDGANLGGKAYLRYVGINGGKYNFLTNVANSTDPFMVYAPTTAGVSGQWLKSTGGVPAWANDGSGSGLDADLLDGTHKSGLLTALTSNATTNLSLTVGGTVKTVADLYATYLDGKTLAGTRMGMSFLTSKISAAGWYRVFTSTSTNTSYASEVLLHIGRTYNSPQNEHYSFSIYVGYNGDISITQLSGVMGGHLITKIRVVWDNSKVFYVDIYTSGGNYENTYGVTGQGYGTFSAFTSGASIPDGYTAYEFTTVDGCKSDRGFAGTLSGNATSATKLQTSRTLWGRPFNGEGNVSGDMTGVGSIKGATFDISGSVGQMLLYNNTSKNDKRLTLYSQSNYAAIYNITADGNAYSDLVLGNNSNALYYDASAARWGIGTTSPAYKLDVAGTLRATGQGTFDTIKITDNTSAAHLAFGRTNAWNYITTPGENSALAIAPGGTISGAGSALCISNSATYPGYHNGTISLGLSSYRWSNVYSVLGNFSGLVTAGSIAVTDKLYIPSPDGNQRYYIKFE